MKYETKKVLVTFKCGCKDYLPENYNLAKARQNICFECCEKADPLYLEKALVTIMSVRNAEEAIFQKEMLPGILADQVKDKDAFLSLVKDILTEKVKTEEKEYREEVKKVLSILKGVTQVKNMILGNDLLDLLFAYKITKEEYQYIQKEMMKESQNRLKALLGE